MRTPTCNESTYQRDRNGNTYPTLRGMANQGLLSTPTATLAGHGGLITTAKAREGGTLIEALSARLTSTSGLLPTPTAHLSKEGGFPAEGTRNTPTLTWVATGGAAGPLHPQFVEWMMGFPMGWTDLDGDDQAPTATDSMHSETP